MRRSHAFRRSSKRGGFISILVIQVAAILVVLGLGLAAFGAANLARSRNEASNMQALQAAQSALEIQVARSFEQVRTTHGAFQAESRDVSDVLEPIAPGVSASVQTTPVGDASSAWITATATMGRAAKSVRTFVSTKDVSIWNNAIFGGTGAAGQSINGNVDVRGSVHLLGEGEAYNDLNANGTWDDAEAFVDANRNRVWDPGESFTDANGDGVRNSAEPFNDTNSNGIYDPPLTTTELSSVLGGNAFIGNHYYGMPTALRGQVPSPPVVSNRETLGTELRVKHGRVSISGSATVGTATDVNSGLCKGKVDGVFVNDGFTGNAGANSVHSDNGTNHQYDLDSLGFEFPLIDGIGAQDYTDTSGTNWQTQKLFLDNRSLTISAATFANSTAGFTVGPDAYGNRITYVPPVKSGNKITKPPVIDINGIVKVNGDLTIGGSKETITYRGSGTMYATGNIHVHANLLPEGGRIFPTTARLGLIAYRNMYLAAGSGDAQLSMAGAFYAQGTIVSAKQNQIAGTFVSNFFDMGTNVPNIYQVPSLVRNMPPGMPGDEPIFRIAIRSWRERLTPRPQSGGDGAGT